MMNSENVIRTVEAVEVEEGRGARVRRLFPTRKMDYLDPFVLFDEFLVEPPAGFPDHMHRGFEFVTYMLEGAFRHRDSAGNEDVIETGGVQAAMTGRGLVHSEMPASPGLNRGIQLWVNLPKRLKQINPDYQIVRPESLPEKRGEGLRVKTVVGDGSPVKLHTPVLYLDVSLDERASIAQSIPAEFNSFIYLLSGSLSIDGISIRPQEGAVLKLDGSLRALANEKSRFVLVAGKPHGEPIRLRGPFVE